MTGLKDQILAAQDLPQETVDVPEWECKVVVRGLSVKQRDDLLRSSITWRNGKPAGRDLTNWSAKVLVRCLRDEDGELIFGSEHVEMLGEKSAAVVNRVFDVAARLSGLDDEDADELGKDSEATEDSASPSS